MTSPHKKRTHPVVVSNTLPENSLIDHNWHGENIVTHNSTWANWWTECLGCPVVKLLGLQNWECAKQKRNFEVIFPLGPGTFVMTHMDEPCVLGIRLWIDRRADKARYTAKRIMKNRFLWFQPSKSQSDFSSLKGATWMVAWLPPSPSAGLWTASPHLLDTVFPLWERSHCPVSFHANLAGCPWHLPLPRLLLASRWGGAFVWGMGKGHCLDSSCACLQQDRSLHFPKANTSHPREIFSWSSTPIPNLSHVSMRNAYTYRSLLQKTGATKKRRDSDPTTALPDPSPLFHTAHKTYCQLNYKTAKV